MEDNENRNLEDLTGTMKAANLQVSRTEGEGNGVPDVLDTREAPRTDEGPSFLNLAGELQDLIITKLHPSAAIVLSQTNRHFHACVDLHRLPFSVVFKFLQEKQSLATHSDGHACYICLRLKPWSHFSTTETKRPRGKWNKDAHKQFCLECGSKAGNFPLRTMRIGRGFCGRCKNFRKRCCLRCGWCYSCTEESKGAILLAKLLGKAGEVNPSNTCKNHEWA